MSDPTRPAEPRLTAQYADMLASDHVSSRTRGIMEHRLARPDRGVLSPEALETLRAAAARVLPQDGVFEAAEIDLAARIDRRLATSGDGWRFAELPPDVQAYEEALATLSRAAQAEHGHAFATLDGRSQDALLAEIDSGALKTEGLSPAQMKLWFTDLRADCVGAFITHPSAQAALGIDAIANGGDRVHQGFQAVALGERADWEPTGPAELPGTVAGDRS